MKEKVEKIESISTLFNVLAWLSLITSIITIVISLFNELEGIFIGCYFLGAYISCLCMQYFFYALYVIALRNVSELKVSESTINDTEKKTYYKNEVETKSHKDDKYENIVVYSFISVLVIITLILALSN